MQIFVSQTILKANEFKRSAPSWLYLTFTQFYVQRSLTLIERSRDLVFRKLTFLINHWLLFRNFFKNIRLLISPILVFIQISAWVGGVGVIRRMWGIGWASVTQPSVLLMFIQNDASSRSTVVGVTVFLHYQVPRLVNYNILILLIHYVNLIKKKGQ